MIKLFEDFENNKEIITGDKIDDIIQLYLFNP